MIQRLRKQITYAVGAGIFLSLLICLIIISAQPAPATAPTPVPTATPVPIVLEKTDFIIHPAPEGQSATVDIVSRLRNPNAGIGIKSYALTFILYDNTDTVIDRIPEETFFLPGQLQYVMALDVNLKSRRLSRIEVELPTNPQFVLLPISVSQPTFSAFARERTEQTIGNRAFQQQTGIVKNTSTFDWQTVSVNVVALSAEGKAVAMGKTTIGALTVGEERQFTIQWPKPDNPISQLLILPATNIYKDDNIIQTVGNPALLQ